MSGSRPDLDIEQLLADFRASGLRELHVRKDGVEIFLSEDNAAVGLDGAGGDRPTAASTLADQPSAAPVTVQQPTAVPADLPPHAELVVAPYLGTFYRSPKPGSAPYVEVGQMVAAETELCLVEVMKLFTAVPAGTAGMVHAILAGDGEMVAADQPLFVIVPA